MFSHRPTTNAIMGLTFANYVIKPFFPDCDNPDQAVRLLAAAVICEQNVPGCEPDAPIIITVGVLKAAFFFFECP